MKKEELYNTKIHVPTQTLSKIVQEYLFDLGFEWLEDRTKIINTNYILIPSSYKLYNCDKIETFNKQKQKEIQISDLDVKIDWCIVNQNLTDKQKATLQSFLKVSLNFTNGYYGYLNYGKKASDFSWGTLLTFEEFELLFIKDKTMKEDTAQQYSLTKDQLILLHNTFNCSKWKDTIDLILTGSKWYVGNASIKISPCHIELLIKEGTAEQKKAVEDLGIVLDKRNEIKNFTPIKARGGKIIVGKIFSGESKGKGFYLSDDYDWEIKNDVGCLCLIPTKK